MPATTPPPPAPPALARPTLLVARADQPHGDHALEQLSRRLRRAAAALPAAPKARTHPHLPTDQHLRARWHATPPHGDAGAAHRCCEIDLRHQARLVIALLAGPAGSPPRDPLALALTRLLERYRPALLWTDDLARLNQSPAPREAKLLDELLLHQLHRTDTISGDSRRGRVHLDDPHARDIGMAEVAQWLRHRAAAQERANPHPRTQLGHEPARYHQ